LIDDVEGDVENLWQLFKERFNKRFDNPQEENTRRQIFESALDTIKQHNLEAELGKYRYKLGLNEFSTLTQQEYQEYLTGFRQTRNSGNVRRRMLGSREVVQARRRFHWWSDYPSYEPSYPSYDDNTANTLPSSINWTEKGWVTPIKNQGQCGSCWAFSTTGALEGQMFNKTGTLVSLSEQNLVDCCTTNQGCNGGVMDNAFQYVRQNGGLDSEQSYPYTGKQGTCSYRASNSDAVCSGWTDVTSGDEQSLQQAVATVGPVSAAIDASSKKFQLYRSGVYSNPSCSSSALDHGILVVGYGSYEGQPYWLVKNSWGTSWGMKGYFMLARDQNNMCGIATMASYPKA